MEKVEQITHNEDLSGIVEIGLVGEIKDLYDPAKPNDYERISEERKNRKKNAGNPTINKFKFSISKKKKILQTVKPSKQIVLLQR